MRMLSDVVSLEQVVSIFHRVIGPVSIERGLEGVDAVGIYNLRRQTVPCVDRPECERVESYTPPSLHISSLS